MKQPILEHARLEGRRIVLRPLVVEDVPVAFELVHQRREILEWLIWEGPEEETDLVPWFESWVHRQEDGENYHLAIEDPDTGLFCGSVGVRFAGHPFQGDVGYWLAVEKWGRGFMSEAVGMITWLTFEALKAQLAYALVFEGNHGSATVLERNGYREDPLGRTTVQKGEQVIAERFFSRSRSDWERAGKPGAPRKVEYRAR